MRSKIQATPVLSEYCGFSPPRVPAVRTCEINHRARPFANPLSMRLAATFVPQLLALIVLASVTPYASLAGEITVTVRGLSPTAVIGFQIPVAVSLSPSSRELCSCAEDGDRQMRTLG